MDEWKSRNVDFSDEGILHTVSMANMNMKLILHSSLTVTGVDETGLEVETSALSATSPFLKAIKFVDTIQKPST